MVGMMWSADFFFVRYWMMGNCLAGDGCPFSHDPSALISSVSMSDGQNLASTDSQAAYLDNNNPESFPPLQASAGTGDQWTNPYYGNYPHMAFMGGKSPQQSPSRRNGGPRPRSRASSRHQNRELNSGAPFADDPDAFPSLGAAKNAGKKHHGKRGANNSRESNLSRGHTPSSVADVVRMTPSPSNNRGKPASRSFRDAKGRENMAAAQSIAAPKNIPWLETGSRTNQQYMKHRSEANSHGALRNRFLQRYSSPSRLFSLLFSMSDRKGKRGTSLES